MKEIHKHTQIDETLCSIEHDATSALNHGKKLYVWWSTEKPDKGMTPKQRGALHVWCEMFAKALNDAGHLRKVVRINGDIVEEDWSKVTFKEDVYKVMLAALTYKDSTEKQSTVDPSEVANHINRHMGQVKGVTVAWPSLRG